MRDLNGALVVELLNLPVAVDKLDLRGIGFVKKAILVANRKLLNFFLNPFSQNIQRKDSLLRYESPANW